jgi:hypothetical protein
MPFSPAPPTSSGPKDSVVATIPRPGVPVTAGQTVVVVASNGGAPEEPNDYVVPDGILGSQASDAERLLKESGVEVKVEITSLCPRTPSSPLTRRQAKRPKPELLSWQSPLADDATHSPNMLDCFLINS